MPSSSCFEKRVTKTVKDTLVENCYSYQDYQICYIFKNNVIKIFEVRRKWMEDGKPIDRCNYLIGMKVLIGKNSEFD